MSEVNKIKAKLINAFYVKEAKCVLMLLECEKGRFKSQVHRDAIGSFGDRKEEDIEKEMEKYVDILKFVYVGKNKFINIAFDPELDGKIKDKYPLKYETK